MHLLARKNEHHRQDVFLVIFWILANVPLDSNENNTEISKKGQ